MTIEACSSLQGYFRGVVAEALRVARVEADPATREYVTELLVTYAGRGAAEFLDRPIVLLLDEALAVPEGARIVRLQAVGDGALFLTGLFSDHMDRAGLDPALYVTMGRWAYRTAAATVEKTAGTPPVALAELAERFPVFVDVLAEVAESSALGSVTKSVVQLYDRWKNGGSHRALEALAKRGAFPVASGEGGEC